MGCDMHWLIERQDNTGKWHTICAQDYAIDGLLREHNNNYLAILSFPARLASSRDYEYFALLADVRNYRECPEVPFLLSTLPEDMSEVANEWISDFSYHSAGWSSLRRLKEWDLSWANWSLSTEDEADLIKKVAYHKENLLKLLDQSALNSQILHLPICEEDGEATYGLSSISAHQKMVDATLIRDGFHPIGPDTIRFFIKFDS
jgi:hypothetical protein